MRILVVEDESAISNAIVAALQAAGYVTNHSGDGEDAWFKAGTEDYDAIILDLGLPRLDGLTVLRRLRSEERHAPVIVLTARGTWMERVEGMDAGADDYLPKPFQMEELLARLSAVLRRSAGHSSNSLQIGSLRLELRRQSASLDGRAVELSALEFRLLRFLAHNPGRFVSQGEILEHVYDSAWESDSNALEVLVARVRRKIGADRIVNRRGRGYVLEG